VDTDRYLLVHHRGPRTPLDTAIRGLTGEPVRTRAVGETPFLRHADAVLPQALIKAAFGEFAVQGSGPGPVTIDPDWVATNIVDVDLPILGPTHCHRNLVPALRGALEDLQAANLGHLVGSYEGCFNARTVAGSVQLSRHAWGAAVDLNFSTNPTGIDSAQDPRLVAVFERWGFGSGDFWLVPDSGHFEYIAPPSPSAT
jgi:D-alanyl-D-alanine carboxypeptidase